ncbi:acyltransferase, WS/DGAT/MGAT [Nakamurella panacisegetis]|uniref:Diacylglycerol O-acyltransferase n=1 Tax=Nakamurella panacisegetis TaxID=1090615 RepID=A0A1H0I628_9ACTN|nr:wax ester/triacylglycerol synthase family O-acyltransferase [Nakamurella panacisegetis]SDO26897.1 acyltransferase, WS/DGAT/MGAT [Nakamurella panacisegetis]
MTDRLSATDAAFLYAEDASTPMHVGGVVILHPEPGTFDYREIVDLISARLSLVPRYRQRVRFVPGRLGRPVWVDDEDFDLTYHVRRSALPKPGTMSTLDELVGRLISRPLDRARPLWEMYVIEGLEGGRIAIVNKTHHAMVDRIGAVDVAAAILDLARRPRRLPDEPWIPVPPPSDIDLVVDAVADIASRPSDLVDVLRLAAADIGSTVSKVARAGVDVVEMVRRTVNPAPRSVLNVTKSGQRRFASFRVDLADVKAIRAAHGASVNDVLLAAITGALRTWLLARGEAVTPTTTLRALVPMSVKGSPVTGDEEPDGGPVNPVVSYVVDMPVAEPNPVMRLHQVSFAMGAHLESGRQVGADSLLELGRFAPPTLHALGARVAGQLSGRMYNLLITNAPGPQLPLFAAGSPVVAMYPVAPLAKGQALAVACTSYNGGVFFGLTADRDAIPDIEEFAVHIGEAVEELLPAPGTGVVTGRSRPASAAGRPGTSARVRSARRLGEQK